MDTCIVCDQPPADVRYVPDGSDSLRVTCGLCGTYVVSGTLAAIGLKDAAELRPYLTCHLRQAAEPTVLSTANWRTLAEAHMRTTVRQKFERFMSYVASNSSDVGSRVTFSYGDYALFDLTHSEGLFSLIEYARAGDLLSVLSDGASVKLTVKGWDYVGLAAKQGQPGKVFVAMSYDRSLDAAYAEGIEQAIRDCGLEPVRVDKIHHEEKVCDRMLAEIRACQVFIGDFTQHRTGVYFEAGFALALGKTVIWTCRQDHLDNRHFDTRQYPHIAWQDEADLRQRLSDRLRALLQPR